MKENEEKKIERLEKEKNGIGGVLTETTKAGQRRRLAIIILRELARASFPIIALATLIVTRPRLTLLTRLIYIGTTTILI